MNISGLQKLTLLDFPGHLAAIVFLDGCNFRCPFCQNSSLVLPGENLPSISMDEFRRFLKKRSGILEGICVTGGEPTLHKELPDFLSMIRQEGYLTKLDTNGTNPDMLRYLLDNNLLNYVAMDIKAGRDNYAKVSGIAADSPLLARIEQSVQLLLGSNIDYEFRTTVTGGLHTEDDFHDIAQWIRGCSRYYLQSFRDCEEILMKNHSFYTFSEEKMNHFLEIVQKEIPQAMLRGIS